MSMRKRLMTINTQKMGPRARDDSEITEEEEEDGEPLSPAGRLFHQPHFNCYIIAIMGSGKTIDIDAVKARMEVTMLRHPRFSSILVSDKPGNKNSKWVRTKVVIDNHIVIPNLNPSDSTSDQVIEDYISSLSTITLNLSRPLWDLHLINMRTTKAEAVAILRMHHSLGDGVSLISLLLASTRKMSDPESLPSLPQFPPRKAAKFFTLSGGSRLWGLLVSMCMMLELLWNTMINMIVFAATPVFLRDSDTPIKGVKGVEFHRKRFVHRTLSLDDFKVIKNAFGCTINDVLLGITSAGFSRYLNRRYGETANGEKKLKNLPTNIRLRTAVIVNIRPTPGILAMSEMMEGDRSIMWGNWLGFIIVPFHITMCDDPLDYIRKAMKIAERKRNSLEAVFTYICSCLSIILFGIKAASALCYRVLRHTTVSLSNIVGPVEEIGFCGHPLVYLAPSVYGHPQAVTLHFQSYMNKIEMVLAVDELTVPDPHQLMEDMAESLKLIKDAVVTTNKINLSSG